MKYLEYETFEDVYFGINQQVLLRPTEYVDYMASARGMVNDLVIKAYNTNPGSIDLAQLGYAKQKWTHLVKTYIDLPELRKFFKLCTTSKSSSLAFDFKRKDSGNGSCMREIILSRQDKKKPWKSVKVVWRATELQKRFAADLILLHHIITAIPYSDFESIYLYLITCYQSSMFVVPLLPLFDVTLDQIREQTPSEYTKRLLGCNDRYYQENAKVNKFSPGRRMQILNEELRKGIKRDPLTYDMFTLNLKEEQNV